MKETKEYPLCSHPKNDCVSNCDGHCIALYDTEFRNNKPCPFYMDYYTRGQRLKECTERNLSHGFITRRIAN